MKFALSLASRNDHEGQTIAAFCSLNRVPWRVVRAPREVEPDETPVGTVVWIEEVLGRTITPDYYPAFLSAYQHRKIWRTDRWPLGHRVFIKPSDRHKRFTGFVTTGTYKKSKKGPFWCSEIVDFVSEWRYYVAAGRVLASRWGSGIESVPPPLDFAFPPVFTAAVDFGQLADGHLALIEANSPYACGWYGSISDGAIYAEWLAAGWASLKNDVDASPRPALSSAQSGV